MRALWLMAAVLLSACSVIYPTSDFHEAPCGPEMQHWSESKPCQRMDYNCLARCDELTVVGRETCQRECYAVNPDCKDCLIIEAVLCSRESGCEIEYEDLTCCSEEAWPGGCSVAVSDFDTCSSGVTSECLGIVLDACGPAGS